MSINIMWFFAVDFIHPFAIQIIPIALGSMAIYPLSTSSSRTRSWKQYLILKKRAHLERMSEIRQKGGPWA